MGLGYRYPRSEPATALAIAASRSSPSDHPSAVGVKIGEIPPNPTVRRDSLATKYSKTISRNHSTSLIVGSALRSSPTHGILPVPAPRGPMPAIGQPKWQPPGSSIGSRRGQSQIYILCGRLQLPTFATYGRATRWAGRTEPNAVRPRWRRPGRRKYPAACGVAQRVGGPPLDHHQGNGARPHLRPHMVPLLGNAGAASHQICCHEVPTILWEWRGTCTLSTTAT